MQGAGKISVNMLKIHTKKDNCRSAFPCFDEPGFKPTYHTTLVRPSSDGYIAISNMPIESEGDATVFSWFNRSCTSVTNCSP